MLWRTGSTIRPSGSTGIEEGIAYWKRVSGLERAHRSTGSCGRRILLVFSAMVRYKLQQHLVTVVFL